MADIFTWTSLVSFLSLALMEIVLGIDNIIFISILCGRLPENQQEKARILGLTLALLIRIVLLFTIGYIVGISKPLFTVFDFEITLRDLILIGGGLFLLVSSTNEIHEKLEGSGHTQQNIGTITIRKAIFQIILLDIVFSFDSILTAIGLVDNILLMVAAVVLSMIVMVFAAKGISNFIHAHPTVKILALSFLLLIGVMLMVEGFHVHVPKGYIYFAIFFSLMVELLNMRMRRKAKPVHLKQKFEGEPLNKPNLLSRY